MSVAQREDRRSRIHRVVQERLAEEPAARDAWIRGYLNGWESYGRAARLELAGADMAAVEAAEVAVELERARMERLQDYDPRDKSFTRAEARGFLMGFGDAQHAFGDQVRRQPWHRDFE